MIRRIGRQVLLLLATSILILSGAIKTTEGASTEVVLGNRPTVSDRGRRCYVFTHRELRGFIGSSQSYRRQSPLNGVCVVVVGILEGFIIDGPHRSVGIIPDKPFSEVMASEIQLSPGSSDQARQVMHATNCDNQNAGGLTTLDYLVRQLFELARNNPCVFVVVGKVTIGKTLTRDSYLGVFTSERTIHQIDGRVSFVQQANRFDLNSDDLLQIAQLIAPFFGKLK